MGKRKNHTDELFRSRLRQFDASPPEEVWKGISSSLDQDRRKQRAVVFWRVAASIAVLVGLGTTYFLLRPSTDHPVAEKEQAVEVIEQGTIPESIPEYTPPSSGEVLAGDTEPPKAESGGDIILAGAERTAVTERETSESDRMPLLHFIHAYRAGLFDNSVPQDQLLIAHAHPGPSARETEEGIDVFEKWGEDGQDSYDRWSVGTQVTPLYSYRSLASAVGSSPEASYFNQVENGLLAYAGGVNVNYSPRKRLTLQSGLYYSKMGVKVGNALYVNNEGGYAASSWGNNLLAVSNSSGTIQSGVESGGGMFSMFSERNQTDAVVVVTDISNFTNIPTSGGEVIQHFEYLELPLIMRYRVVDRKVGFNVLGGLSTNFLVGRDAYFQQEGEKEFLGITENLKTVNYSSVIGVGLDYAIGSKLNLNFEPTFRYYLNSINALTGLKSHPYSFGFYTGLSYSF